MDQESPRIRGSHKNSMMKHSILLFLTVLLVSCQKHDFNSNIPDTYAQSVGNPFGVSFPSWQDWKMTESGEIAVEPDPLGNTLLVCLLDSTGYPVLKKVNSGTSGKLSYDIPKNNLGLYICKSDGTIVKPSGSLYTLPRVPRRSSALSLSYELLGPTDTYASKRGWDGFPSGTLYEISPEASFEDIDYQGDLKDILRAVIFTYFPNGKGMNNLPQIKESGYYNEKSYPITTGSEPIVISPIYKNDGTSKEVENCDLYYYYFPASQGTPDPSEIKKLPLYKAITLKNHIKGNDVLEKHTSFTLLYWDTQGNPSEIFPENYKIGFMLRSKVSSVKQGELWCDGRLNKEVNKWGHFASSKLDPTDPRMAWLSVNSMMLLCCESGTDRDFNDLIFEVSGGIELITVLPEYSEESYMFCFEDQTPGDYDLNDVVIRGRRLSETKVEYSLMAVGAHDDLYIRGVSGEIINDSREVHEIFGGPGRTFINTEAGHCQDFPIVSDTITVDQGFSFLVSPPWIFDKTRGYEVHISEAGQDPHAIMIPWDFKWPTEKVCVKDAYPLFNSWGLGKVLDNDWYK